MRILDRCGALTGAAYVVLVTVGNTMSTDVGPGPHPDHPAGQQDIDYLHRLAGSTFGQVGVTFELLSFAALMLFVGYLCTRVRAGGWLATAALAGGVVSIAVKLGSAAPMFAAYVLRDEISPETARVLSNMNGAAFVVDWLPTGLFVACAAGAALATHTLGRILGWGGVVAGTGAVIVTAVTRGARPGRQRPAVPGLPTVDPGGQRPAGGPANLPGGARADTGCGAVSGVTVLRIPRRSGKRHHDAVGAVTESRAGWTVAGLSAGVVGFWLVLGGLGDLGRHGYGDFVQNAYPNIVFALAFPVAGALILSRLPGHRLGWLYCLCGLACAVTLASYSYAERGLVDRPGSLPGALAAGWVSSWIWICGGSPLLTFGVLWFPDGRLPSRRWWPVAAAAGLSIGLRVISVGLRPGPLENHPVRVNPLGLPLPRSWFHIVDSASFPLLLVAIVGSLAALAARYRRASADERDQLRWLLIAVGLLVVSFALVGNSTVAATGNLLALVAIPLLPLSVGVAVLRQRLDSVDVTVRRSLVYGWLLAAGLAVYAGVVLVLDAVLRGHAAPVVTLVAAGAVAVLYQPLRLRLQRAVDRMLYGDRGDPYAVLTRLGRRLQAAGSAEQTLPETVETIAAALRLPYVAVELLGDPPAQPTAAYGTATDPEPVVIPLTHGGDAVGRLVVGRRDTRDDLTPAECRLLGDLGSQVAVAAHAVLLDRALRRSRERLVVGREEERRRLRRDLHDGLGPALAGVALGVDAARNMLRSDPRSADALLADLKHETLGCVGEVRRIVEDLRPPALDELGLLPALTAFVDRLSTRDEALQVAVQAPDPLPRLPAAVEVAAYRIATEAMTNVARHAHARTCLLRLEVGDDLTLEVSDDGVGVPAGRLPGVGLPSMAERAAELGGRCVVGRLDGGGTQVLAHLPLAAA